jgi:hypothetical protein
MPKPPKSAPQMAQKAPWPADKVQRRPVAKLVPYARNARTHSPAQIDQLARSIEEFGWTIPVLVDEQGVIIAGHGRVLAALQLKLDTVPVMVAAGWTDAQRRAYVIADNQLALNAGWDKDLLKLEMGDLADEGFDLTLTGMDLGIVGERAAPAGSDALEEVGTDRRFWISVQGPIERQADALHALKLLAQVHGVEVQSNLVGG